MRKLAWHRRNRNNQVCKVLSSVPLSLIKPRQKQVTLGCYTHTVLPSLERLTVQKFYISYY